MENNIKEKLMEINEKRPDYSGFRKNSRFEVWQVPPIKKGMKLYTVTR